MKRPYMTLMQQEVASLWCVKGLSFDEIGELLEMSPRTAANHMQKVAKGIGCTPTTLRKLWPTLARFGDRQTGVAVV